MVDGTDFFFLLMNLNELLLGRKIELILFVSLSNNIKRNCLSPLLLFYLGIQYKIKITLNGYKEKKMHTVDNKLLKVK